MPNEPQLQAADPDVARAWRRSPRATAIELTRSSNLAPEDIATLAGVAPDEVHSVMGSIPRQALGPTSQGEMRSRPPGIGRTVENMTGSIRAGQITQKALDYMSYPAKALISSAKEGGENLAAGIYNRDPVRAAGGALQIGTTALPFVPGGEAFFATAPRAIATGFASQASPIIGSGALSTKAQAQEAPNRTGTPAPDMLQSLYAQRSALQQQVSKAQSDMDQEAKSGKGHNWQAAKDMFDQLSAQMSGINQSISDEQRKRSPEYQAELKKRELETPFRQKYPAVAQLLSAAGTSLSFGLPFALGAVRNLGSWFGGSYAGQLTRATEAAERAIQSGDQIAADMHMREINDLIAREPKAWSKALKAGLSSMSGAGLAAEGSMLPDQIDAMTLAEGPSRERARKEALNPVNYAERGAIGILTGATGTEASGLVPRRLPAISRASAAAQTIQEMRGRGAMPPQTQDALEGAQSFLTQQRSNASQAEPIRHSERLRNAIDAIGVSSGKNKTVNANIIRNKLNEDNLPDVAEALNLPRTSTRADVLRQLRHLTKVNSKMAIPLISGGLAYDLYDRYGDSGR